MKYKIIIKKANGEITFENESEDNAYILEQLAKIFISKEIRGVKTKVKKVPYQDIIKITQYFDKDIYHITESVTYYYEFIGITY